MIFQIKETEKIELVARPVPRLQAVSPDLVVLHFVAGHFEDVEVKDESPEPLFKLLSPVLDGVHRAQDQDSTDLLAEIGHEAVDEGNGL